MTKKSFVLLHTCGLFMSNTRKILNKNERVTSRHLLSESKSDRHQFRGRKKREAPGGRYRNQLRAIDSAPLLKNTKKGEKSLISFAGDLGLWQAQEARGARVPGGRYPARPLVSGCASDSRRAAEVNHKKIKRRAIGARKKFDVFPKCGSTCQAREVGEKGALFKHTSDDVHVRY